MRYGSDVLGRENQKKRSEAIRAEIIDKALDIAVSEGFEALSVRKLAEKMKYSTGVVYYHFKDKAEITGAIQARQIAYLKDKIEKAVSPEKSLSENIRDAFHEAFLLAVNEPEKYNLVVTSLQSRRDSTVPPQKNGLLAMLADMLRNAVNSGVLAVSDADSAAFAVWSSFGGLHLKISQMDISLEEAEKLFDVQVNIILHGLIRGMSK